LGSCEIKTFNDIKFLYTDVSNCDYEEVKSVFDSTHDVIENFERHTVYSVVNVEKAEINTGMLNNIRNIMSKNKDYVALTLVFGLTGFQRTLLDTLVALTRRKVIITDSYEEACLWLQDEHRKLTK